MARATSDAIELDVWGCRGSHNITPARSQIGNNTVCCSLLRGEDRRCRLVQTARFKPRGLAGLAYWYAVLPLHGPVFSGMLRGIERAALEIRDNGSPEDGETVDAGTAGSTVTNTASLAASDQTDSNGANDSDSADIVPVAGFTITQLTTGSTTDARPAWAPDCVAAQPLGENCSKHLW